jgi:methionyl aminopeptidase
MGSWQARVWDDGWTAVTADGSRTAQFEHTVLVTDDGVDVLTRQP